MGVVGSIALLFNESLDQWSDGTMDGKLSWINSWAPLVTMRRVCDHRHEHHPQAAQHSDLYVKNAVSKSPESWHGCVKVCVCVLLDYWSVKCVIVCPDLHEIPHENPYLENEKKKYSNSPAWTRERQHFDHRSRKNDWNYMKSQLSVKCRS